MLFTLCCQHVVDMLSCLHSAGMLHVRLLAVYEHLRLQLSADLINFALRGWQTLHMAMQHLQCPASFPCCIGYVWHYNQQLLSTISTG